MTSPESNRAVAYCVDTDVVVDGTVDDHVGVDAVSDRAITLGAGHVRLAVLRDHLMQDLGTRTARRPARRRVARRLRSSRAGRRPDCSRTGAAAPTRSRAPLYFST